MLDLAALDTALLTPSRPENITAGNERHWNGTNRNESAGKPMFCLVKAGVRVPLAPPEETRDHMASGSLLPGVVGDRMSASITGRCTTVALCGVVAARYAALPGSDNGSALISVISSYPMWRDFVMSVNVAGTVSSSLGNEQERSSRTTSPCLLTTFAVEPIINPVRVSDAIDILACDVFQRADPDTPARLR